MEHGYEESKYQQLKISALAHSNEEIRAVAADLLVWDEPVSATTHLLKLAATDTETVAVCALDTLVYYSSKQVLFELDDLRKSGRECLKGDYEHAFSEVSQTFGRALANRGTASEHFKHWLGTAAELLTIPDEPLTIESAPVAQAESVIEDPTQLSLDQIMEDLNDADGLWKEKKDRYQYSNSPVRWKSLEEDVWKELRDFFLNHPDHEVRDIGCTAARERADGELMMAFLDDPIHNIRKSAAYSVRYAPQSPEIADRLWARLQLATTTSTNAYEVLESWIAHANDGAIDDVLLDFALIDQRETACMYAICNLGERNAKHHIAKLLPMLDREPIATWAVHGAILDSCNKVGIRVPNLNQLFEADGLYLQLSICEALNLAL